MGLSVIRLRDLASATRRTYRQALTPLVEALGGDRTRPAASSRRLHRTLGGSGVGDLEHPTSCRPGLRFLVSGAVAADRRAAGRGGATTAKGR